ncbi:histone-like nucleoid-structuring protein Lsr2 [Nostocoides jenkinsii]|uniref:Protein lsr2 n=1 Tax=Nostocoides jenkinsii Ben 74 TaxID=1193518 RepID=A0A077MFV7_9MICO|nr:Lsr2 family protein [Tetrasphaera jenkinsii]CCI54168.1 Protein lsr2 [Tetrasphaera jenkinsii Ben 74]
MVQRVHVVLEDDLDRSPADETVSFALDGVNYEIDLSAANAAKLRDDLANWVANGRRTGGRKSLAPASAARGGGTGRSKADLAKIRTWARDNGHPVSDRGRISASVQEAYDQANA